MRNPSKKKDPGAGDLQCDDNYNKQPQYLQPGFETLAPKGTPFRESFATFPKETKPAERRAQRNFRLFFTLMLPVHLGLLFVDAFVYRFEIPAMIFDCYMVWSNFYNYRTLNKITALLQVAIMVVASVAALTHLQRVLLNFTVLRVVCFSVQYFLVYPVGAKVLYTLTRAYIQDQMNIKNATIRRKAGGRLVLAGNRKLMEKLPILLADRINEMLRDCKEDEYITAAEDAELGDDGGQDISVLASKAGGDITESFRASKADFQMVKERMIQRLSSFKASPKEFCKDCLAVVLEPAEKDPNDNATSLQPSLIKDALTNPLGPLRQLDPEADKPQIKKAIAGPQPPEQLSLKAAPPRAAQNRGSDGFHFERNQNEVIDLDNSPTSVQDSYSRLSI